MTHQSTDLPALLRARGHRLTPQRQIILDTLCAVSYTHLTLPTKRIV